MTEPVFFAEPGQLTGLQPGALLTLGGSEGHHARTVRRLAVGEPIDVVDGAGRRASCTVDEATPGGLQLLVESVEDEPANVHELILVQALAKGGRDEMAIEAATELGVDGIVPWQAERSIVRWKAEKAAKGRSKWEASVRSAAKQSRRARIPQLGDPVHLAALAALCERADLALILHESAASGITALRDALPSAGSPGRILLVVGPEGGISSHEIDALTAAGARPLQLGGHVLRSSTAGPAATAVINHLLERWN
ncbi:16S rRNA (uracil(1498)-N(3))-methyltransferase [Arthrobacter castelli]|uniref:16S rRNA (uracil(1498)-N(3))-methyltransferase n=1 Tax=Arthrobacter castelli TaxID=271431 RepID=UPI0004191B7B|nr:16S rRNA (uracil(1498)-N(3))-methyltransferase [Arthrobacter castelli]